MFAHIRLGPVSLQEVMIFGTMISLYCTMYIMPRQTGILYSQLLTDKSERKIHARYKFQSIENEVKIRSEIWLWLAHIQLRIPALHSNFSEFFNYVIMFFHFLCNPVIFSKEWGSDQNPQHNKVIYNWKYMNIIRDAVKF